MVPGEVFQERLSEAKKDVLIARIAGAAAYLGIDRPPVTVFRNDDGTYDANCVLEGEPKRLKKALTMIQLDLDFPP